MMYNNIGHFGQFGGWGEACGHMGAMGFSPAWLILAPFIGLAALIGLVWVIGIKGYALWHAAKRGEKWWFIALLIINTAGILELIYLIFFAKVLFKKQVEKFTQKKSETHTDHTHTEPTA